MSAAEPKRIDKSVWPVGPWTDEPDRVEFEHSGFACLIVRVPDLGHLCGYVAVPPGHPWHGKTDGDIDADVHGGITYAKKCAGEICHVPKPGEPDDVWWLGFDHAHLGDLAPYMEGRRVFTQADTYKTVDFVRRGCEGLARQAAAARGGK